MRQPIFKYVVAVGKDARVTVTGAKNNVRFLSSDPSVAEVVWPDGKTVVRAKKVGKTTITVWSGATKSYRTTTQTFTVKVLPKCKALLRERLCFYCSRTGKHESLDNFGNKSYIISI